MGKVTIFGGTKTPSAPVTFAANFADNTWEQIIEACETNTVPDTWEIGDQKTMTINGTDYLIDIIGKNHDEYSDSSGTAPLTFQMHDCYGTAWMDSTNNSNGWSKSTMRKSTLPSILSLMPEAVQSGIKEVNKKTPKGSQSTSIETTADKLFLLSEQEVFGSCRYSAPDECTQYEYYVNGNSKIKTYSGTATNWWLRNPDKGSLVAYSLVSSSGKTSSQAAYTNGVAFSFAFCF